MENLLKRGSLFSLLAHVTPCARQAKHSRTEFVRRTIVILPALCQQGLEPVPPPQARLRANVQNHGLLARFLHHFPWFTLKTVRGIHEDMAPDAFQLVFVGLGMHQHARFLRNGLQFAAVSNQHQECAG
jgi:hypothetical protein